MVDSCYCKILFLLLFFFLSRSRCEKNHQFCHRMQIDRFSLVLSAICFFLMVFVPEKTNIWTVLRSIFYVPRLSIAFHFLCRYSISHLSHFARVYHVPMYAFLCYSVDSIGSWKRTMCRFFFSCHFAITRSMSWVFALSQWIFSMAWLLCTFPVVVNCCIFHVIR